MGKGGKREGAGRKTAQHTILAEAAKKRLIAVFVEHQEEIYAALVKQAGSGNIQAIKEMFERVWGKSPQPITDPDGNQLLPFEIIIKPKVYADGGGGAI